MPRRIILHAGFHKTGTKTVQAILRTNRATLKQHVAIRLRAQMRDLLHATRGYSTWRDPLTMIKVEDRFAALLDDLPGMPRRSLILSAEELCGHLPGRGDLSDYGAAPELLYVLRDIAARRFPAADIMIYLTTRDAAEWRASAYWEHVKSSDMTMDYERFAELYPQAPALDDMAAEIASRVPCPVHVTRLEDCADDPLGPAGDLLRLCDLPDELIAVVEPVAPQNKRPDADTLQELLRINRRIEDPEDRRAAKKALLQGAAQ